MEWWQVLIFVFTCLLVLMFMRLPVAFAFLAVNVIGFTFLRDGSTGIIQLTNSISNSLISFALVPIPLFVLMGEIVFHTGIASKVIETLDKWLGRIPGRLSLLSVVGGTMLSSLTGSSVATTSILGTTLVPDMTKKGYQKPLIFGPILASGMLAVLIPPSALAVLLASLGQISVGSYLIAIIIPGILGALVFSLYVLLLAKLRPNLAPVYNVDKVSKTEVIRDTIYYILPLGLIIFLVVGFIFLGWATPTESAAFGVLGSIFLTILYKSFSWKKMAVALEGSLRITVMLLMLIAGSEAFSQILAFSGVGQGITDIIGNTNLAPILVIILMLFIVVILGTIMEPLSILMIVIPIYLPIVEMLGYDLLWFAVMLLVTVEIGAISPPFGLGLFVMKSVAPEDTSMMDLYKGSIPFILLTFVVIGMIMFIPELATFLPDLMKGK